MKHTFVLEVETTKISHAGVTFLLSVLATTGSPTKIDREVLEEYGIRLRELTPMDSEKPKPPPRNPWSLGAPPISTPPRRNK